MLICFIEIYCQVALEVNGNMANDNIQAENKLSAEMWFCYTEPYFFFELLQMAIYRTYGFCVHAVWQLYHRKV